MELDRNGALLPAVFRPGDILRRPMTLAVMALALALIPSLIGWWRLRADAVKRDQERFEAAVRESVDVFNKEVIQHLLVLGSLRGQLAKRSEKIDEAEWRRLLEFTEWRMRTLRLSAVGYAEPSRSGALTVRWIDSRHRPTAWKSGDELLSSEEIRKTWAGARTVSHARLSAELPGSGNAVALQAVYTDAAMTNLSGCLFAEVAVKDFREDIMPAVRNGVLTSEILAPNRNAPLPGAFSRTVSLAPAGHEWRLQFAPGPMFFRESQQRFAWLVLAGGLVGGGLLAGLTWTQAHMRLSSDKARCEITALNNSLEARVSERTAALFVAESELRQALKKEREIAQLKSSFVNMVSHEFRTPLGVILSSADILEAHLERLSEGRRREHLHIIQRCTHQMASMLENVLLLGRIESGKASFQPKPLDLCALAKSIADEVTSATSARCVIDCRVEAFTGETCGDEALLRHILANLLSNAVKYSPAGSTVILQIARAGGEAVCTVQDHGLGIPGADMARLFEAFHRGSNVGQISGTGLGMTIVKLCVDMHCGRINIDSEEGSGTTVAVHLPLFHTCTNDQDSAHRRSAANAGEPLRDARARGVCSSGG